MSALATLAQRAEALRALHVPGTPLVLPNVWDAASARAVEAAGFPVVATGSAAVARSLGYEDGEQAPVEEMLAAVARIVRVVSVPVTADMERGYGLAPAELVERLAATGCVGANIEDSEPATETMIDAERQAELLAAIRAAADAAGSKLVLNARIDTFMNGSGSPEQRLADALRRAALYRAAGADCLYPIAVSEPDAVRALVREGAPINLLLQPGSPPLAQLAALGVARVSYGPGLHRATQAHTERMLSAIRAGEDPFALAPSTTSGARP